MKNTVPEGPERDEYMRLGDEIYDSIPDSEKLVHAGERIAIDLKTREYRFYESAIPREALAITGPTWTSIVSFELVRAPMIWH